jgi:ABC-2 type transport system permease protein
VKRKEYKKQQIIRLLLAITIIILLNILSGFVHTRIDLTTEKRYTLSPVTISFLKNLDDVVYFRLYLKGEDLPPGFVRLQRSLRETLDDFRIYAGDNIQYEFIDPFESPDLKTRGEIGRQLMKKGLIPTTIELKDEKGGVSEKLIFSGAIVTWRDQEVPLEILKNNVGISGDENLNNSIQALEFELIQSIVKLTTDEKKKIAFIEGHGEFGEI